MKKLTIPLPPMPFTAIGYLGDARWVAIYFGSGDEAYHDDGQVSGTGNPHAYLAYVRHPAVALEVACYNLGSSDFPADHWLLIDRQAKAAYAAEVAEARRFLREQWPVSEPAALTEEEIQAIMEQLRRASRALPTPDQIMLAMREQHRLEREMVAWLDATPQAQRARETICRLVEGDNHTRGTQQ